MKFKNKDGTVNSFPIVLIFTVVAIAAYVLLFGIELKQKVDDVVSDLTETTTKATETTTIILCNGCSMSFISDSFEFASNSDVDVKELLKLDKVSLRSVQFSSSNEALVTVKPYANSFKVSTSNLTGSAVITAKYDTITISATINVINPSNGSANFKYDYYFLAKKRTIEPEISTQPYGLNIDDAKYSCANDKVASFEKDSNVLKGNQVGETLCTITKNGKKSTTKVYVIYDYIRVKTNQSGEYQEARSITPNGNSFDIQVTYDDFYNDHYDYRDLNVGFEQNDIGATITYVGPATSNRTWIYHIEAPGTGHSRLKIWINDAVAENKPNWNSFTYFDIYK